jgi:hypothetical protein
VRNGISPVLRNFVGAFKVKVGDIEVGIEQARGKADTGNLEQDLPDLLVAVCEAGNERSVALGIFLDEVQYLSPVELAALIVACHEIAQRDLPPVFCGGWATTDCRPCRQCKILCRATLHLSPGGPTRPDSRQRGARPPSEKRRR